MHESIEPGARLSDDEAAEGGEIVGAGTDTMVVVL
jgi:hypothetical protein